MARKLNRLEKDLRNLKARKNRRIKKGCMVKWTTDGGRTWTKGFIEAERASKALVNIDGGGSRWVSKTGLQIVAEVY